MKTKLIGLLLALTVGLAQAQDVSGSWKGTLIFPKDIEKIGKDATEKKAIKDLVAMGQKFVITLNLKKDKTFEVAMTPPGGKKSITTGTWSQKDKIITTVSLVLDGKAVPKKEQKPKQTQISKDGKSMLRLLDDGPLPGVAMLFKR